MKYYNPLLVAEASPEELQCRGISNTSAEVLEKLNWFQLVDKNGFTYDKTLFKLVKLGIPILDTMSNVYVQNYELKPLTNDEQQTLLNAYKDIILRKIDNKTSADIVAGFDAEIAQDEVTETFHFSYDELDQGNFVDMSTRIMMASITGTQLSDDGYVSWNGYRNHTDTYKGDLVVLKLTIEQMQNLYFRALVHKSTTMARGKNLKLSVSNAVSITGLKYLISQYGLEVDDA